MADKGLKVLPYRIDDRVYGLVLEDVEKVVRAVEITRLNEGPSNLLGVITVQGEVLPVLSMRRKLGHPFRDITPADSFIIARAQGLAMVLVVDSVLSVEEYRRDMVNDARALATGVNSLKMIVRRKEEMMMIHDLVNLTTEDLEGLDETLSELWID